MAKRGRKPRRIDRVGIELEGGWNDRPHGLKGDASVSVTAEYVGEVVSAPIPPNRAHDWVMEHYPHHVNSTCGIHVHFSTRSKLDYALLMETDRENDSDSVDYVPFQKYLIESLQRWGQRMHIAQSSPFWSRLSGNNQYCKLGGYPEGQFFENTSRYHVTNYCYSRHGTVEIRVLPAFKHARFAASAIDWTIRSVERYLGTLVTNVPSVMFSLANLELPTIELNQVDSVEKTPYTLTMESPT